LFITYKEQRPSRARDFSGCWTFPKRIIDSSEWLDFLWSRRDKIKDKPALILWGMKDIAFREQELNKWSHLLRKCNMIKYEDVGHFVQEEMGPELCQVIKGFLKK